MIIIVDRIEGGFAVAELEDGSHADIPLGELPEGTHEGSVLKKTERGWELDLDEERRRRERAAELTRKLFGRR